MKTGFVIIALALLCGCSHSISSGEASRHIGERCTVEGYVASVHATGRGTVFLNFDNAYPNQTFTAVSLHGELSAGDLQPFAQRTVRVSGKVEDYKGKPEIVLHSLDQLSVVK
jgi:DNA/RNA endonuclease YhcR with UshA esterase domain